MNRGMLWTGRILSGLVALFLLVDGGARLAGAAPYLAGMAKFGFAVELAPWVGASLHVCTILYLIPRTVVLGAILLTDTWAEPPRPRCEWVTPGSCSPPCSGCWPGAASGCGIPDSGPGFR